VTMEDKDSEDGLLGVDEGQEGEEEGGMHVERDGGWL
jgi:hypothetical protein